MARNRKKKSTSIKYRNFIGEDSSQCYELRSSQKTDQIKGIELLKEYYSQEEDDLPSDLEDSKYETEEFLGKRLKPSNIEPPQEEFDDQLIPDDTLRGRMAISSKKGKYLDPKTGAYYNTIEEFKKIRALLTLRELEEEEFQKLMLKKLFLIKKRRLTMHKLENRDKES